MSLKVGIQCFGEPVLWQEDLFHSKRAGKVSIHFNAEPQQAVLLFRTQCLPPISSVFTEQVHFWSKNQCEQVTYLGA